LIGCAADNRVDPSALDLRDVLGMAPEVALGWDLDQRAAARHVLEAGMRDVRSLPSDAPLTRDASLDHSLATALASSDAARSRQRLAALGVVAVAIAPDHLHVTSRASTLAARKTAATEIRLAGWDRWPQLPARGLDVLATIASDAGHRGGPLVVTPSAQLAVIAGYVPPTRGAPAHLLVNPVLLASLEPSDAPAAVARIAPDDPIGNPYTFYTSIASCAAAQQQRCEACLVNGTCTPLSGTGDGNAECTEMAANAGRGYSLACINFALAIESVSGCAAHDAPTCPIDTRAASSIANLETNADFLDQPSCSSSLDQCLGEVFGNATPSATTPPPSPGSSVSCADSACEASPDCSDMSCDGGGDSSSCDDSSGDSSSCDSGDSGSCDSSCSGDSGGDCSGGDSGCSGDSGGDCSGGGGNDCNAGPHRGPGDPSLLWAALPLPFAIFARRRAGRRRAQREVAP